MFGDEQPPALVDWLRAASGWRWPVALGRADPAVPLVGGGVGRIDDKNVLAGIQRAASRVRRSDQAVIPVGSHTPTDSSAGTRRTGRHHTARRHAARNTDPGRLLAQGVRKACGSWLMSREHHRPDHAIRSVAMGDLAGMPEMSAFSSRMT